MKYRSGKYSESDFHASIESIMPLITELEYQDFLSFMHHIGGQLELIDFTSSKETWRKEYTEVISELEKYLANYNFNL